MTKNEVKSKNKDFLFLAATHGDEGFSIEVLKKLDQAVGIKNYDWLVANEKALISGKRFVDCDLNRAAPGDTKSNKYEVRRASEILTICRNYKYVIDLHGTSANTGIFIIITIPTPKNMKIAAQLPISNVVIWPGKNTSGPITQYVDCGVEIECGPKESIDVSQKLFDILTRINGLKIGRSLPQGRGNKYYQVMGSLLYDEITATQIKNLEEFKRININGESFYPLLIGRYSDRVCMKLKRIVC